MKDTNLAALPTPETATPLSTEERATLRQCERRIKQGHIAFVQIGEALETIGSERLHRESHDTFEAYVEARWGYRPSHAHRLRRAAKAYRELAANVSPGTPLPETERQMRELIRSVAANPGLAAAVWCELLDKYGVNAAPDMIRFAAARVEQPRTVKLKSKKTASDQVETVQQSGLQSYRFRLTWTAEIEVGALDAAWAKRIAGQRTTDVDLWREAVAKVMMLAAPDEPSQDYAQAA